MGKFKPGKILTMEDKQDELLGEFCCHAIYKPFDRITNSQNFSRLDRRSKAKLIMFHELLSRLLGVKVVEDESMPFESGKAATPCACKDWPSFDAPVDGVMFHHSMCDQA